MPGPKLEKRDFSHRYQGLENTLFLYIAQLYKLRKSWFISLPKGNLKEPS